MAKSRADAAERAAVPGPPGTGDLVALAFASGATGLVYESLWMRGFGLVFGNTTDAVAAVLATFMGGLALGSALAGRRRAARPLRAYALVEAGIGLTALLTLPLLHLLPRAAAALGGAGSLAARVLGSALVVLPTTLLMGATVPLLVAEMTRRRGAFARSFGRLYLVNTLGGALGVALAGFVLVPALGTGASLVMAAAGNLLVALAAWRRAQETAGEPGGAVVADAAPAAGGPPPALPLALAAVSGAASFALEVLWTRSYALVIGSSVYAFNAMLLAFLLGLALGALVLDRLVEARNPARLLLAAWLGLGLLVLASPVVVGLLPVAFLAAMMALPLTFTAHQVAGFALCFLTMLPVTAGFGLAFPLLARLLDPAAAQRSSGRLYAANTAGAIAGALAADLLLVPRWGLQSSYPVVAAPLLAGALLLRLRDQPPLRRLAAAAALLALAALAAPRFRPWDPLLATSGVYKYGLEWRESMPSPFELASRLRAQRKVLFYEEGAEAVVAVTESADTGHRFLSINGKTDAGNGAEDVLTQKYLAHVSLLHHPDPRRVLVVGWGAGATAASAALHPVRELECVEIEPATWRAAPLFADLTGPLLSDPRLHVTFADARNQLLQDRTRWDVIVSEPSNPWISGVSNLFTREFYEIVRGRLAEGGVFGQWFHYYNLRDEDVRVELRTFLAVFPHASLWLVPPVGGQLTADLLLVGSVAPHRLQGGRLQQALAGAVGEDLRRTGAIDGAPALLATWAMGGDDLRAFAGQGPLNTDAFPWLEFQAPRSNVAPRQTVIAQVVGLYEAMGTAGQALLPPITHYGPAEAGGLTLAAAYEQIAAEQVKAAQPERARRLLAAAAALDPESSSIQARLGEVLLSRGRAAEAEAALQRAVALDPSRLEAWNQLAGIALDGGDLDKAARVHRELLKNHPSFAPGHLRLAAILARQKEFQAARDEIRTAQRLDPRAPVDPQLVEWLDRQAAAR